MQGASVFLPQMRLQFDQHITRRENLRACVSGADILAAPAARAGLEIEQLFPGELLPLFHAHAVVHARRGERPNWLHGLEVDIERNRKDVEEFGERQAGNHDEGGQDVKRPDDEMQGLVGRLAEREKSGRDEASNGRPCLPVWPHDGDAESFGQVAAEGNKGQQDECVGVVARQRFQGEVLQASGARRVAAIDGHAQPHDDQQAEQVQREFKGDIDPAREELETEEEMGDIPVHGGERGTDGEDEHAPENGEVHQAWINLAQRALLSEHLNDHRPDARPEMSRAFFRLPLPHAQDPPRYAVEEDDGCQQREDVLGNFRPVWDVPEGFANGHSVAPVGRN